MNLFVSYELAKILKEKGFNEPCLAYYNPVVDTTGSPMLKPVDTDFIVYRDVSEPCVKAPLYQQVVDWFREKYKIDIELTKSDDFEYIYYFSYYTSNNEFVDFEGYDEKGLTYYQSLNKAIEQVLKVI